MFLKKYETQTHLLQNFQQTRNSTEAEDWLHDLAGVTASLYMKPLNETIRKVEDSVAHCQIEQSLLDLFENQFLELIKNLKQFTNTY